MVLTDMAEKEALDDVFDRSIKRWTQTTLLIDTFAASTLSSYHFTRPVANFVRTRMDGTVDKWRLKAKDEGFLQPKNVQTSLFSPP